MCSGVQQEPLVLDTEDKPGFLFQRLRKDPLDKLLSVFVGTKAPMQDGPLALSVSDASLGRGVSSNVTISDLFTLFGKSGRK